MLAVKLHKKKKPFMGAKSYLIPIINWRSGKTQIKNWITLLNDHNAKNPNNRINYITLVKIPDDHYVFLACDWSIKKMVSVVQFKPLKDIESELKEALGKLYKEGGKSYIIQSGVGYDVGDTMEGTPLAEFPELILGESLPASCIKWTKDIKLLYHGTIKLK